MFALVAKELTEQANRKRTYALRMLVAMALGLAFLLQYLQLQQFDRFAGEATGGMLGRGHAIFQMLIYACLWSVIVVVPGMTAAALTEEKESGTLPLLILSRLGIRGIILQKWLSRMLSACALLLPALPLGAIAYACGGVEPRVLTFGLVLVGLTIAWTSAVSLAASAWCRTTTAAIVVAYLLIGGMCLVTGLDGGDRGIMGWIRNWIRLCPPRSFESFASGGIFGRSSGYYIIAPLVSLLSVSIVALVFTLLVARRRAEVTGRPWLLRVFAWLDRVAVGIDQRLFKRTTAVDLPITRPVRWREIQGRSLCNWRYLLRWLLPALVVMLAVFMAQSDRLQDAAGVVTTVIMAVAMLALTVRGAAAFAGERDDQTLAVLLTTPMTPEMLVRDKMAGLRRLHVAAVMLLSIGVLLRWYYAFETVHSRPWLPLVFAAAVVLIPAVTGWSAMLIGLMIHPRAWAVVAALGSVLLLNIGLPYAIVLSGFLFQTSMDEGRWRETVALGLSPALLPALNELEGINWDRDYEGSEAVITWVIVQTLLWIGLRQYTLCTAGKWLRRRA